MPPPFFPADRFGMIMSPYGAAPVLAAGGWAAPPPPPPPPPSADSSGTHARGSGQSDLESDSRKRGRAGGLGASGGCGSPPAGLGGGLASGESLGTGGGLGSGGGLGGSSGDGGVPRGRDRRRRGRGRDQEDFDPVGASSGGLGAGSLTSGGLDVPHGSLLPRMLPQTATPLDANVPQGANFTAFGSYAANKRSNQHGDSNDESYEDACLNAGFYGQQGLGLGAGASGGGGGGRPYGAEGGLGAPANGSAGHSDGRQRNRRR